jgi:carboxylesterase
MEDMSPAQPEDSEELLSEASFAQTVSACAAITVGVLLVHGLNGSLRDMEELADFLASRGMVTETLLLPGHGTHVRDMLPIGWDDWVAAVKSELQALQQRCDRVFLVGHSLGGALCLHIAAHEEISGLVTMCAPITMYPGMLTAVRLIKRVTPWLPTVREDVRDRAARRVYTAPVESMLQYLPMLRSELSAVKAPILIMLSLHDHVVPARDGRIIYRLVGSQEKHLLSLHRSYHVIMKDYDRVEVFARTLAFIQQHAYRDPASDDAEN